MSDKPNEQKEQEIVYKRPEINPYLLFKQIDDMRKEGVLDETIKTAFVEFMQERQGNFRKVSNSRKRTPDSTPMPSQEDINKMYEDALVANKTLTPPFESPEDVELFMAQLENVKEIVLQENRPSIRKYRDKIARLFLIKLLRFVIWSFSLIGVK